MIYISGFRILLFTSKGSWLYAYIFSSWVLDNGLYILGVPQWGMATSRWSWQWHHSVPSCLPCSAKSLGVQWFCPYQLILLSSECLGEEIMKSEPPRG